VASRNINILHTLRIQRYREWRKERRYEPSKKLKQQRERIKQAVIYKLAKYLSNMKVTLKCLAFGTVFI
jgi:hypothetical protein